jgi:hypothetical protein
MKEGSAVWKDTYHTPREVLQESTMTAEESKPTYSGTSEYGGHPPSSITEDIYPVHTLDDTKTFRMFINWTMCFNDVLDPERLHNSLSRLLNIGDWRKLGGRLRVKV